MGDRGFAKTDMERVGLFQEMGYTTIGDRFIGGGPGLCKYILICLGMLNYILFNIGSPLAYVTKFVCVRGAFLCYFQL